MPDEMNENDRTPETANARSHCEMIWVDVGDGSGVERKCVGKPRWHTSDGMNVCTEHAKGLIEALAALESK